MTLVLSCLTPDYVIQVSDKRITRISDGAVVDDLRNKGTLFCAQMAFGYTGLAEIDGIPTDQWLAEVLANELTLEAGLKSLVARASEAFRSIPLPAQYKRHAFVGVGFCRPTQDSDLRACQVTVSNFLSAEGQWLSEARPSFEIEGILRRDDRPFTLCRSVGARVPEEIFHNLEKNIRACLSHKTGPLEVMRLMAETVHRLADSEPAVGKALLLIFVPRQAVESQPILFITPIAPSGLDRWDTPKFLHIPADSPDRYWDLPNFVCGGMFVSGAFEQDVAPDNEVSPRPDAQLSAESYRRFLSSSEKVKQWAEFVRSLGVRVDSLGFLSRDFRMLQRTRITTPHQIEQLLGQSESWGRKLFAEYYATCFSEVIKEGKFSLVRSGIVTQLLVANYPDLFSAEVLLREYGWALAERFLSIAARHSPRVRK